MLKALSPNLALFLMGLWSLAASANPLAFLSEEPEFLPVDQAFVFEAEVIEPGKVEIFWNIADGYYLYKEKFKFEAGETQLAEVALPPGKSHEDEFFGVTEVYYNSVLLELNYQSSEPSQLVITYMGCAEAGLCYPPTKQKISLPATLNSAPQTKNQPTQNASVNSGSQADLASKLASGSQAATLALFFLLGLGLAFTPCVFPMYPILSAVISGGEQRTKAHSFVLSFTYVQGMALTYTLLGLLVASFGMQLQAAFQHPAVLIGLSLLFGLFALSMFGLFSLQLPQSWQEALQSKSQNIKGGHLGPVFLLGIIAGLVASPCTTAPLSAALLYVGQSGDLVMGGLSLYVLSLGMGLPLLVIGTLGGHLLPRSGAWMNHVKHLLGFVTLAVPIFLLERIVPETWSLLLWALLMVLTGGYLLAALREAKQLVLTSLGYSLAGVLLVSGTLMAKQAIWPQVAISQSSAEAKAEFGFVDITNLDELESVLLQAQQDGKPTLIDFYADWCVACKEFDKYTFPDPGVQASLADFVLIRADVTASSTQDVELLENFEVLGLPSLLLFDRNGEELTDHRIAGFLNAEAFVAHIERAYGDN